MAGEVVDMAKKQHAWALLAQQAQAMIEPSMAQPSGEFANVTGNDGHLVQVPEMHGGFALIGEIGQWRMLIGCGMDFAFQSMITQLQQAGMQTGTPVGVLLAIVDDIEGTEEPNLSQLDVWMPAEAKANADAWLSAHGYDVSPNGSYRDVIEHVGGVFRSGFQIGQDYIA